MVLHAGDGQVAEAGAAVGTAPQVRVVGETGAGVAGVQVAFEVVEGGGSVAVSSVATGTDGVASAGRWTLGQEGPQRLEASAASLGSVVFRAGASGMPAALEVVRGDGATGEVGTRLSATPEVRVLDDQGRPMAFVPVTFAADQGSIGTPRVFTDERGHAAAGSWTLGTQSGPQQVVAAVAGAGVKGNPAVFRAVAMPSLPRRMEVTRSPAAGEAGQRYLPPATVRITDAYGNGVPHIALGLEVLSGRGTVSDAPSYTDDNGQAVIDSWTLGRVAGEENALSVKVLSVGYDLSGAASTLAVVPEEPDFDLWLVYPKAPEVAPMVRAAMDAAKTRWETAINGDLPATFAPRDNVLSCVPNGGDYDFRLRARIPFDDLMVLAFVGEIDGPGGLPARSTWCGAAIRAGEVLPSASIVQIDAADVDALAEIGLLEAVRSASLGPRPGIRRDRYLELRRAAGLERVRTFLHRATGHCTVRRCGRNRLRRSQGAPGRGCGSDPAGHALARLGLRSRTHESRLGARRESLEPGDLGGLGGHGLPGSEPPGRGRIRSSGTGRRFGRVRCRRRTACHAWGRHVRHALDHGRERRRDPHHRVGRRLAMSTSWKKIAATCVALAAVGCEQDPAALDPSKPVAVVIASGNNQTGQIGAELPLDPRVRVIGQTGLPVQGVSVQFQVEPGSGAVVVSRAVTDGQGIASAGPWTLGDALGEQQVAATAADLPQAVFTATATDVPALVEIVAGAGQEAQVGAEVEVLPTVRVLNADGAPVANLPVTFVAASGFVAGAENRTGTDGRAAVGGWTLGTKSGAQELVAAVAGGSIEGNPAVFRAFARPGPPMVLEVSRGDGQEIEVESPAVVRPEVRVLDAHGNGVPRVGVLFEATSGGGAVLRGEQITDPAGLASVAAWFAGPAEGRGPDGHGDRGLGSSGFCRAFGDLQRHVRGAVLRHRPGPHARFPAGRQPRAIVRRSRGHLGGGHRRQPVSRAHAEGRAWPLHRGSEPSAPASRGRLAHLRDSERNRRRGRRSRRCRPGASCDNPTVSLWPAA